MHRINNSPSPPPTEPPTIALRDPVGCVGVVLGADTVLVTEPVKSVLWTVTLKKLSNSWIKQVHHRWSNCRRDQIIVPQRRGEGIQLQLDNILTHQRISLRSRMGVRYILWENHCYHISNMQVSLNKARKGIRHSSYVELKCMCHSLTWVRSPWDVCRSPLSVNKRVWAAIHTGETLHKCKRRGHLKVRKGG